MGGVVGCGRGPDAAFIGGWTRTKAVRLAVAILLPMVLAGCATQDGLGFAQDARPPDPYYKEHRALLAGEHHEVYEVPVNEGARELNVSATLRTRDNGLPSPGVAPASLRVQIIAPDGAPLAERTIDAREGSASLVLTELPGAGAYLVRVDGVGASQPIDGEEYGAEYLLVAEVLY